MGSTRAPRRWIIRYVRDAIVIDDGDESPCASLRHTMPFSLQ